MLWAGLGLFTIGVGGLLGSFLVTDISTAEGPAWAYYVGLGGIIAAGAGVMLIVGVVAYEAVRLVL